MSKTVKVKVEESLATLAKELNLRVETVLQETMGRLTWILAPYKEQLKNGIPLGSILSHIESHAQLGFQVDRKIREVLHLKYEDSSLEDCEVKLEENYYWFDYTTWERAKTKVDEVHLWIENGIVTIAYEHYISKKEVEKIRTLVESGEDDFYGEDMDYDCDYKLEVSDDPEFPKLALTLQYDEAGLDFPDVKRISRIFNRLEKKALAVNS